MPGPRTPQDERAKQGRHATNKGALSGVVQYLLDSRAKLKFIDPSLSLASGEEATVAIAIFDAGDLELHVEDKETVLDINVLVDDPSKLEIVTDQPVAFRTQVSSGVPDVHARTLVRAKTAGSVTLSMSGTTSSAALGLDITDTLGVTIT